MLYDNYKSAQYFQKTKFMLSIVCRKFIAIPLVMLVLTAVFWTGLEILSWQKITYGVRIGKVNLGGKTFKEAEEALKKEAAVFDQTKITFSDGRQELQISAGEIVLIPDFETALGQAQNYGQSTNPLSRINQRFKALFFQEKLPLPLNVDTIKFRRFLKKLSQTFEQSAQNARLYYDSSTDDFIIEEEKNGWLIDKAALLQKLTNSLDSLNPQPIFMAFKSQEPLLKSQDLQPLKEKAKNIVSQAPYYLIAQESGWTIEGPQIASWITVSLPASPGAVVSRLVEDFQTAAIALEQNGVKDFLLQLAPSVNQKPINATLAWENDRVVAFSLARPGRQLKIEESAQKISQKIAAGQKNIELVYETTAPQIATESLNMMGLTSLLGQGESNFAGSPPNRQHNIAVGTARLNGLLIEPGAEFSFVQSIGSIDESAGYLPELVIKNNKTIPEYGGGICQVSTTLFRAAVKAGLKITERYPHAIALHYYDPPGFDATVYPPQPDLKFVNDTPNKILLQAKISGTKLAFEVYGTADGRQIKIKGPKTIESKPDGSKKTVLVQEVWREGKLERQDTFRSNYKSPDLYPITSPSPSPLPKP